jgi:ATP-dependent RNA helicase DDX1
MGLAISIVTRTKEKVWYHTCPTKGQGCSNRNVATLQDNGQYHGGCCIWYNEPECELQVMRRAGRALEELDPVTLTCPTLLDPSKYGRAQGEAEQLAGLTPQQQAVAEHLAALDTSVQQTFLRNKMSMAAVLARFHKKVAAA